MFNFKYIDSFKNITLLLFDNYYHICEFQKVDIKHYSFQACFSLLTFSEAFTFKFEKLLVYNLKKVKKHNYMY